MRRLKKMSLAPSHTTFYRKLDQFGLNHDAEIKQAVKAESERLQKLHVTTTVEDLAVPEEESNDEIQSSVRCENGVTLENPNPLDKDASKVIAKVNKPKLPCANGDNGRKIVLDNIDLHQVTHDMTQSHKDPDLHFCSHMSTENRVSGNHLSYGKPIANIIDMDNGIVLPSKLDQKKQRNDYVVLVSRYLVEEISCLHVLKNAVVQHIPHQYSDEMKKKTKTVSLIGNHEIVRNKNRLDAESKVDKYHDINQSLRYLTYLYHH